MAVCPNSQGKENTLARPRPTVSQQPLGGTDTPNLRSLEEWQHYVKEGSPTSRQKRLLEQSQFAAEEFSKATGLTARHLRQPDKSW